MIHKISYIVYAGVDNIVISIFLGIIPVGLLSNYMLIFNQTTNLLNRVIQPMSSSIGNLIYSEEKGKGIKLLYAFNLLTFFIGSFVSISYMVLFQPVIKLWLGNEYLLPISLVFMISINSYFGWVYNIFSIYRDAFGGYEKDRKYMIMSAIINLILSISLVKIWGLTGVFFGTVVGHLIIIYGRIKFIFDVYIKESISPHISKHIFLLLLATIEGLLTYYISIFIPLTILGVLWRLMLCLIIPNIINFIIFYKTKDFEIIKIYLNQILKLVLQRIKEIK